MSSTLQVFKGGVWYNLCDSGRTMEFYKGATPYHLKSGDFVRKSGIWEDLCPPPDPNYPFGFDYVNRVVTVTPPIDFHHRIDFKYTGSPSYPWGGANDFILRSTVDVVIADLGGQESVEIRGHNPLGSIVWMFGPNGLPGTYSLTYDFPMSAVNNFMRIHAFFTQGSSFTITTAVLSGGSPYLDWSGIPFPIDYDSND